MASNRVLAANQAAKQTTTTKTKRENPYEKGTRYYDLYEANPYTEEKFTREKTFWDEFANTFGFRSGYDAALDEWQKAGLEYDAQIAQLKGEDEYNSPEAKAARMRAAGENPDLLGTEGVSEAGEFAQEQTSPDTNAQSDQIAKFQGFVSEMMKGITFGLSMSKDTIGILGGLIDNEGKKYDTAEKMQTLAKDFIEQYTPEKAAESGKQNREEIWQQVNEAAYVFAKQHNFTEKEARNFQSTVRYTVENNPDVLNKRWTNNLKNRREYQETNASRYTSIEDDNKEVLALIGAYMEDVDKALAWGASAEHHRNETESMYQQGLDPGQKAATENQENIAKEEQAKIKITAKSSVNDVIRSLDKYAEKGNVLAIVAQAIIPMIYTKYVGNN